jgi:hypothetical protein
MDLYMTSPAILVPSVMLACLLAVAKKDTC